MRTLSRKPSNQRRLLHSFSWHRRIKQLSAPLARNLRQRFGVRSLVVRKGDTVKVVSGGHKGKSGKVARLGVKRGLIYIEGITESTAKGKAKMVGIHVSNVTVTKLDLSDKYRRSALERRGVSQQVIQQELKSQEEEPKEEEKKQEESITPAAQESTAKQEESVTQPKEQSESETEKVKENG